MKKEQLSRTANGINIVAAIWLILSPFVLGFTTVATFNIVLGIVIGIASIVAMSKPYKTGWVSWVNIIAGALLVLSPFFYAMGEVLFWNNIVIGIVVAGLAMWGMAETSMKQQTRVVHRT